ncbi:hypothetical protein F5Y16DRAFT_422691 [Xylariaceae sp. FL0255]|nr:hypothetical protein F5Y16DRAFT_422691 [Xylariaceae sp. FL0255]
MPEKHPQMLHTSSVLLTIATLILQSLALPQATTTTTPTPTPASGATETTTAVETGTLAPDSTVTEDHPTNFSTAFITALVIVVLVVGLGTTICCIVAQCWRPILNRCCGDKTLKSNRKLRKRNPGAFYCSGDNGHIKIPPQANRSHSQPWLCGTDRGIPVSQNEDCCTRYHHRISAWDPESELGKGSGAGIGKKPSASTSSVILGNGVEDAGGEMMCHKIMPVYEPQCALR